MIAKKMIYGLLISGGIVGSVYAKPATGIEKKHVALVFDVMSTTPTNILANADNFAKYAPYLDGVSISLNHVLATGEGGSVVTAGVSTIMSGSERWTRESVKEHIPTLRQIATKPHLKESFLLFWMSPKYCDTRLDWADDKAWANYAENMAVVSWLAKEGNMKGLMLDPEEYANARQFSHTSNDPPFAETAKLARQRGREVFSRVFREYPDIILFTLWYFAGLRGYPDGVDRTDPVAYADDQGVLSHYFYNGILDVITPTARIIDGCEHYSLSATRHQYLYNANSISTSLLAFVDPENRHKYLNQVLVGNTLFLDMYAQYANPLSRWYHGPVNGSRLEHLRQNFAQSLLTATEYVWIYGEKTGKLFNWNNGHYGKIKTWEENIPGMTETFMLVKDPERYAAMKMEKLSKEGKLINLVEGAKPIKFVNPRKEHEYYGQESKLTTVTDAVPGDRYIVSVNVRASYGRRQKEGRYESACPRVIWLKNGRGFGVAPTYIEVPKEVTRSMVRAEGIVTVPEGANGFIFDLACKLNAGENVEYRYPSICNALDPVKIDIPLTPIELAVGSAELLERPEAPTAEDFAAAEEEELNLDEDASPKIAKEKPSVKGDGTKVSSLKWKFDPARRLLSNGHWKLSASVNDGKLRAYGFGSKTHGGGVLDLRNVKADTGYEVYELGGFKGYDKITAVIAPNLKVVETRGFSGCSNLNACVVGDIFVGNKTMSKVQKRKAIVNQFSQYRELADTKIRYIQRQPASSGRRINFDISTKDVKPGELFDFRASLRWVGSGNVAIRACFRDKKGSFVGARRSLIMKQPRQDGVWREGEALLRAPENAAEAGFSFSADICQGDDVMEFDKFAIYKISEPLPVWPSDAELEKGTERKLKKD